MFDLIPLNLLYKTFVLPFLYANGVSDSSQIFLEILAPAAFIVQSTLANAIR